MQIVTLVANTWTDLSAYTTANGEHLSVLTELADVKTGRKATAPSNGILLSAGVAQEQIIKAGDVLKLWAHSVAGGNIMLIPTGGFTVVTDGTGTT